jgi:hypothetical protein
MGNQAAPLAIKTGVTLAYVKGSPDTITDSGSGFITAGFAPGQTLYTFGASTAGNDLTAAVIANVTAGTITLATNNALAGSEAFPAGGVMLTCKGGSIRDMLAKGALRIYGGTIAATADGAITGTLIAQLTSAGATFTPGSFANAISLGPATAGVIGMAAGEVWSGTASGAGGVATHYRFVGNATDNDGATSTLPRIQGSVATSGGDATMVSTTISPSQVVTVTSWSYTYSPT